MFRSEIEFIKLDLPTLNADPVLLSDSPQKIKVLERSSHQSMTKHKDIRLKLALNHYLILNNEHKIISYNFLRTNDYSSWDLVEVSIESMLSAESLKTVQIHSNCRLTCSLFPSIQVHGAFSIARFSGRFVDSSR